MARAAGIWVKSLTGSSGAAGLVAVCIYAPSLLRSVAGVVVDRVRRRPFLIVVNMASAVAVLPLLLVRSADQNVVDLRGHVYFGQGPSRRPSRHVHLGGGDPRAVQTAQALGSRMIEQVNYRTVYITTAATAWLLQSRSTRPDSPAGWQGGGGEHVGGLRRGNRCVRDKGHWGGRG